MKNKKKVQLVSITRHVFLTMAILWEVASGSGCGNILSGSQNGLIKSPNYPRNYPRHADCSWTVVVPLGHKISLSFDEFRVEMSAGCKKDWLKVYDGASSAATLIGKHCGSAKPSAITSSGSKLHLQFRSNGALQFKGFQATYNSSLVCGGTYLGKQGSLTSPGYPGTNYPNEATCLYKVVVPSGYTIKLRFNDLKLEAAEADGTCYDDIQVFDGPTSQDAGLGKYCGHQQPFSIHSTSNVLLIRFKSDRTTRARGFKAVYTAQAIPTTKLMTTTPPTRPPKTCWSTEFRCDNGKCIKHQWRCDKENDCGDNSDERGCPCPTHQSKCRNGNCIDLAWKCNGVDDCGDNSDEQNCTKVVQSKGCSQSNGGCEHTCTQFLDNQRLSVRCSCQTGYRLQNDQKHCADTDECLDGPLQNGGCHQICENTPGSRRCLCHKGYFLSVNKVSCEDIDECANYNGGCTHDCVNTAASFYCQCRPGFQLQNDRKTCSDVNECAVNNGGCSHRCENLDGGYKCHCPHGYQMGKDNKTCTDVDECATGNGGCKYLCNNKQGSFECTCPPGYVQDYRNPNMCHDIDECMEGIPACFNCINTLGSYECSCDEPGFIANAKKTQCMNINECATNNGGCGKHRCIDSYGSYRCECLSAGYQLDPSTKKCKEIDECAKNNGRGDCDHFCTNTDGSYSCGCRDGYKLRSEKSCLDIDECAVGAHQCEHFCNNTDGSYICTCKKNSFIAPDGYSCTKTKNLPDCGLAPSVVEPTEDGWEAAEEVSWPWTALLHFSVFGDIEGCMGTLIDREWVITTSHCVSIGPNSMDPKHVKVELGVYRRSSHGSPPKLHSVKQIIIHSEYNAAFSKLTSNIALVQLAEPIVVTDNLRPICLPTRHEIKQILRPGIVRKGVVIGWGKTENHRVQGSLKQAQVNVVHYHHCTWAGRLFNATKMICAGYDTESACMSDSGSPIMFPVTHPQAPRKWILGGILSWGVSTLPQGCHKNYGYSAYTKVGQQLNWIKNQMKKPN